MRDGGRERERKRESEREKDTAKSSVVMQRSRPGCPACDKK